MRRIKGTEKLVKQILQELPATRNSDMLLYFHVCRRINPSVVEKPFWAVILNLRKYGFPPIESVGRARRKIQGAYPELCGNDEVEEQRLENEMLMKNYARKVTV